MKTLILLALAITGLNAEAGDPPSVHGMLLFGKSSFYVSHLPMYHRPHDYQAILKVSLGEDQAKLADDMAANPNEPVYTIEPERFVLPDVIQGLTPFKATVYRGHFERGGKPLFQATITPVKLVNFKKLNASEPQPKDLGMLVFGEGTEHFAAHIITKRPNFDQVVELNELSAPQQTQVARLGGVMKVSGTGLADTDPLVDGALFPKPGLTRVGSFGVKKAIYLETGDLEH